MVVARKSAVSAKGTWFQRHFTLPLGKRRSERLGSATPSTSTLAAQVAPLSSKKQRRSSKNLSAFSTNE